MEWRSIESAPLKGKGHLLGRDIGPFIMLIAKGEEIPTIGFWNGNYWDDGDYQSSMSFDIFTHWMPLPEPPK